VSAAPDDPTEVLGDDEDEPTRDLGEGGGEEPTRNLGAGEDDEPTRDFGERSTPQTDILLPSMKSGSTEEMRTRRLAEEGPPRETEGPEGPGREESRRRGIWMLVGSIVASLAIGGIYIAAGGLDYKPGDTADPCAARTWTAPGNLEESVQQFALSAVDGAACDLGVSREELTRALADEESRNRFAEENGLSEGQIEEAVRSGINRAIDDAEEAGALGGLAATGLRAAVRFMPIDQMIPLIQDASVLFDGNTLDDAGSVIDGVIGELNGESGSLGESLPDGLGDQLPEDITEGLRNQLPDEIERNIPESVDERIQKELDDLLNP